MSSPSHSKLVSFFCKLLYNHANLYKKINNIMLTYLNLERESKQFINWIAVCNLFIYYHLTSNVDTVNNTAHIFKSGQYVDIILSSFLFSRLHLRQASFHPCVVRVTICYLSHHKPQRVRDGCTSQRIVQQRLKYFKLQRVYRMSATGYTVLVAGYREPAARTHAYF